MCNDSADPNGDTLVVRLCTGQIVIILICCASEAARSNNWAAETEQLKRRDITAHKTACHTLYLLIKSSGTATETWSHLFKGQVAL